MLMCFVGSQSDTIIELWKVYRKADWHELVPAYDQTMRNVKELLVTT